MLFFCLFHASDRMVEIDRKAWWRVGSVTGKRPQVGIGTRVAGGAVALGHEPKLLVPTREAILMKFNKHWSTIHM